MRSARCLGVYVAGARSRSAAVTGAAHSKQNFAPGGSCVPHWVAAAGQGRGALQAELGLRRVVLAALGALHGRLRGLRP
jgi:hypothetical protein